MKNFKITLDIFLEAFILGMMSFGFGAHFGKIGGIIGAGVGIWLAYRTVKDDIDERSISEDNGQ